jgi:predicted RNA-binding Zn-ribbon protein involved in translation (DUF1610 family)
MIDSCRHQNLVLVIENKNKVRCSHCHVTINKEELETDYCPECWETEGVKRRDFEKVEEKMSGASAYRCEDCGAEIETE